MGVSSAEKAVGPLWRCQWVFFAIVACLFFFLHCLLACCLCLFVCDIVAPDCLQAWRSAARVVDFEDVECRQSCWSSWNYVIENIFLQDVRTRCYILLQYNLPRCAQPLARAARCQSCRGGGAFLWEAVGALPWGLSAGKIYVIGSHIWWLFSS